MLFLPALQGCTPENVIKESSIDRGAHVIQLAESILSIDPHKCVGCGRCVMMAPQNFVMNGETRKAMVLLSEKTKKTQRAIDICPTVAISLS